MRFHFSPAIVAAALVFTACQPAHAFTSEQAQAYLLQANPSCTISAYPPVTAHLQGSDKDVSVLKYAIEACQGGHNHAVLLAVLYDAGDGRIASYDNRGLPFGNVDELAVHDGRIVVTMLTAGPSDPLCCPSRKAVYRVVVSGGKLVVAR